MTSIPMRIAELKHFVAQRKTFVIDLDVLGEDGLRILKEIVASTQGQS